MKVLAFTGFIGCGKTTAAHLAVDYFGRRGKSVFKTCFAHYLKALAQKYFWMSKASPECDCDSEGYAMSRARDLIIELCSNAPNKAELPRNVLDIVPDDVRMELGRIAYSNDIRKVLQFIGTDIARKYICEDYWCKYIENVLEKVKPYVDVAFIDDCRFLDEAESLRSIGGRIIQVQSDFEIAARRMGLSLDVYMDKISHASEQDCTKMNAGGLVVNNTTMGDLRSQVYTECEDILL